MARATVIDRGLEQVVRNSRALQGRGVKIGVQSDAGRDPDSGVSLVDIAIINEYGTDTIPARPAMRDFFEKNRDTIGRAMDAAAAHVQDGRMSPGVALGQLGELVAGGQKAHVQASKSWATPNAPATVRRKGSDTPLIDDGVLVNAIRAQVVDA